MDQHPAVKLLILGGRKVGKSAIIVRYLTRRFIAEYSSEKGESRCIGAKSLIFPDHLYRREVVLNHEKVLLEVHDVTGDWLDKPESELRDLMNWANGVVAVYDICDRHSFRSSVKLLQQLSLVRIGYCPTVLIGNKQDMAQGRRVDSSEGRNVAARFKAEFYETSAVVSGQEIAAVFEKLVQHCSNLRQYVQVSRPMRIRKTSSPASVAHSCPDVQRYSDSLPLATPTHKTSLTYHFNFFGQKHGNR